MYLPHLLYSNTLPPISFLFIKGLLHTNLTLYYMPITGFFFQNQIIIHSSFKFKAAKIMAARISYIKSLINQQRPKNTVGSIKLPIIATVENS